MSKLDLDKYYTPPLLAKELIGVTMDLLEDEYISEVVEPSAGSGSFSLQLSDCTAMDIKPEHPSIKEINFLEEKLEYKKGRLFIGNPPFGIRMKLAKDFYKKCCYEGDYIAFILPISQLNNIQSLYQFDLVKSIDLGPRLYTDRKIHCCFNIYKRPTDGFLNKKESKGKLKFLKIVRQDSKAFCDFTDYDIRFCYWGNGSGGKVLKEGENSSAEYKIKINLPEKEKERVLAFIKDYDWRGNLNFTAMVKIQQHHIHAAVKGFLEGTL